MLLVVTGGVCAAAYGANMFYHDPTFAQESLATRRLIIHVGQYEIDPNHFSDALIFPAAILACGACGCDRCWRAWRASADCRCWRSRFCSAARARE